MRPIMRQGTSSAANKTMLVRRVYTPSRANFLVSAGPVQGYEIHMGRIHYGNADPAYSHPTGLDGAVHPSRPILGTFIHDIFSNPRFTRAFVNMVRQAKGLAPLSGPLPLAPRSDGRELRETSRNARFC